MKAQRNRRLDAGRGILIILVVVGHFIEVSFGPNVDGVSAGWLTEPARSVLVAIYVFHMPAFAFLVGITARRDKLLARMGGIAALLIAAQVCYVVVLYVIRGHSPTGLFEPYLLLWFLAAMLWWYAALPIIDRLPATVSMTFACGISLLAGFLPVAVLTLVPITRTLTTIGQRSLAVYVFHYALVLLAATLFAVPTNTLEAWVHMALALALAGVAVAITAQAPCEGVARAVMSVGRRAASSISYRLRRLTR